MLKIENRFPGGSVRLEEIRKDADPPEVHFAADPRGGAESLWFYFRLVAAGKAKADKVKLVLRYFQTLSGDADPAVCRPVYKPAGKDWFHTRPGKLEPGDDGQVSVSWLLDFPDPSIEIAAGFPYNPGDVGPVLEKSRGYWQSERIGLTQGARPVQRVANDFSNVGDSRPGIYIVAREYAGETPASWVLDGFLRELARLKDRHCVTWVVPFVDIDGIMRGEYGRGRQPVDIGLSWGTPAARHEANVIQADLVRWKERCTPGLVIALQSPGIGHGSGVVCQIPQPDAETHDKSAAFANQVRNRLGRYAAPVEEFKQIPPPPARGESLVDFAGRTIGIPALTVMAPWGTVEEPLSRKCYRQIGQHLAEAALERLK